MAESPPQTINEPGMPVENATYRQRFLLAFSSQAEIYNHLRTQTAEEEFVRLPEIMAQWEAQQQAMQALLRAEAGMANQAQLEPLPPGHEAALQGIANDDLFKKTFYQAPFGFAMVAIDSLIAPKRAVNLDYVEELKVRFADRTGVADLVDSCLWPTREMPPIGHLEVQNNSHVFSSRNLDIRFLGAFPKSLTPDDSRYAVLGGVPSAAIIAFIGYGASSISVLRCDGRLVLNNGFHRVFALRSMGVTKIPVVVQQINNPQLEFPSNLVGLPKEYLLGSPRPAMMKDFLRDDFCIEFRAKARVRVITLNTAFSQFEVPL
jgi:hypothetical protein